MQHARAALNFNEMAKVSNRVKSTNDIELKDRLVAINRVTKVTKGGRTFSFAAIVVVGRRRHCRLGLGKSRRGNYCHCKRRGVG